MQQALRWLEGLGDQNVRELREVTFWYQCGMVYELTVDLGAVKAKVSFANWTRKYEDKGREQMGRVVRKIIRKHRGGGKGMGVEGWKRIVLYLDGVLRDHHASRR